MRALHPPWGRQEECSSREPPTILARLARLLLTKPNGYGLETGRIQARQGRVRQAFRPNVSKSPEHLFKAQTRMRCLPHGSRSPGDAGPA